MLLTSPISFPNLGITVDPSPVAFTIFGKEIYWYGIIIACGFLLAVLYMMYRANTFGLTQDDVLDLILWAVPIGVVCARLYYCVFYWDLYRDNPISMLYIWEGGLAIYGGIIGGAITVLVLSRVKKIPPLVMLDNASMGVLSDIYVSGVRADDMALRFLYAGFPKERIHVQKDYAQLMEEATSQKLPVFVMPTYTAMLALRGTIAKRYGYKEFWQ